MRLEEVHSTVRDNRLDEIESDLDLSDVKTSIAQLEVRQFEKLINILIIGVMFLVVHLFTQKEYINFVAAVVFAGILQYTKGSIHEGNVRKAIGLCIAFSIVIIGYTVLATHGLYSERIIGLLIPLVYAAVLGDKRIYFITAGFIGAVFLAAFWFEITGLFPYMVTDTGANRLVFILVFFGSLAGMLWQTSKDIRQALDIAHSFQGASRSRVSLGEIDGEGERIGLTHVGWMEIQFNENAKAAALEGHHIALMRVSIEYQDRSIYKFNSILRDEMLKALSIKIKEHLRQRDQICLLGRNQFLIMVAHIDLDMYPDMVEILSEKISHSIKDPLVLRGIQYRVNCNVGVAVSTQKELAFRTLLDNADVALNDAQGTGKGEISIYDGSMRDVMSIEMESINKLKVALESGLITVGFQGRHNLVSGQMVGCEAIFIWNTGRVLDPMERMYLELVEGLGAQFDRFLASAVCKQLAEWDRENFDPGYVSILVRHLRVYSPSFEKHLGIEMATHKISSKKVFLEIDIHGIDNDIELDCKVLGRFNSMGIGVSVGSSGSGRVTMGQLTKFPLNLLILDEKYTMTVLTSINSEQVVQGMAVVAALRKIDVCARGITSAEMRERLGGKLNVKYGQGEYFGPIMDASAFKEKHSIAELNGKTLNGEEHGMDTSKRTAT